MHSHLRQDLIIWFVDIMTQHFKSKQRKQVCCFLHHINCPSKRLLEGMKLIEANIILLFCNHIYHLHIEAIS